MNQAKLYIEPRPAPTFFDELTADYEFLVDAASVDGIPLYFTFHCEVDEQGALLTLKRREVSSGSVSTD